MKELKGKENSVRKLMEQARNEKELSEQLQDFTGVGTKTAEIFLRDVRKSGWNFKQ